MEAIDTNSYMVSVLFFHISVENGIKIMQISVGVDISMAVSTTGDVYGWGCTKDGRSGVKNIGSDFVSVPHKIEI